MTPKETFKKVFGKNTNFMTPNVIRYGRISDDLIYELSWGNVFNGDMYGVTVIKDNDDKDYYTNYSKACVSRTEAEEYIAELKGKFK